MCMRKLQQNNIPENYLSLLLCFLCYVMFENMLIFPMHRMPKILIKTYKDELFFHPWNLYLPLILEENLLKKKKNYIFVSWRYDPCIFHCVFPNINRNSIFLFPFYIFIVVIYSWCIYSSKSLDIFNVLSDAIKFYLQLSFKFILYRVTGTKRKKSY